jgi:prefoldin subunit 5
MIEDTIDKIEARLRSAESIKEERRQELLELLGDLKAEVAKLSTTHDQEAQSIAGLTERSAYEATRGPQQPESLKRSLKELSASVEGFEGSHPRLVETVSALSQALSNLGI